MNSPSQTNPHAGNLQQSTDNFAIFESLEDRVLLSAAPTFGEAPGDYYWLNTDGLGLTLGIDGEDADGDNLTVSISADDNTGLSWEIYDSSTSSNHYAVMHYFEADGVTPIGDIVVQLFEDRAPVMTERFITLSTMYIDGDGNIHEPTVDNPAFYTDVDVHRIMDEFMFQTGDAVNGDGTGGSPLENIDTETDAHLAFTNGGVLAAANTGVATSTNSQWFITEIQTPWLNGGHTIFGHIISGQDVYQQIINTAVDTDGSTPLSAPILGSVDITTSPQDATVTIWADETFTGPAEITITLDDGDGHTVDHVVTVMPQPVLQDNAPNHIILAAGQTATAPLNVEFSGDLDITFHTEHTYSGAGLSVDVISDGSDGWLLQVDAPADYDGSVFDIKIAAEVADFENRYATDTDFVGYGEYYTTIWFDTLSAEMLVLNTIDNIPELAPGESQTIQLDIEYDGDIENDLTITTSNTYDNGGVFAEPVVSYNSDQEKWEITVTIPEEYNGNAFEITVNADVDLGVNGSASKSQSFSVQFGSRPTIPENNYFLVAPNADTGYTVELDISGGLLDEYLITATSDDPAVTVTVDNENETLTIVMPDDYTDADRFNLSISIIEDFDPAYDNLTPYEFTTEVVPFNVSAPDNVTDAVPGGSKLINIPVTFTGDIENDIYMWTECSASSVKTRDILFEDGQWKINLEMDDDYNGQPFQITVIAKRLDISGALFLHQTFTIQLDERPQITDPGFQYLTEGFDTSLQLTTDHAEALHFEASASESEIEATITDAGLLDLDIPEDFSGTFTVTISVVERSYYNNYSNVTPATFDIQYEYYQPAVQSVLNPDADTEIIVQMHGLDTGNGDTPHAELAEAVTGVVSVSLEHVSGYFYKLTVELDNSYDGSGITVNYGSKNGGQWTTERSIILTTGQRPQVSLANGQSAVLKSGEINTVALDILSPHTSNYTIDWSTTGIDSGDIALNGDNLDIDLSGFAGEFTVTVWATENSYSGKVIDSKHTFTFTAANSVQFESELDSDYLLSSDGYSLTIGVDGWDPDDSDITISASSDNNKLQIITTNGNPVAELKFEDSDGNIIGSIFIELFENLSEDAVERFITLATQQIQRTMYDFEADTPGYDLLDSTDPGFETAYYTDCPVYNIIPGVVFYTGNPSGGDGSTRSGMEYLTDHFGTAYAEGTLGFAGRGVVGFDYEDENTADGNFFISNVPVTNTNGSTMVLGQVISGWETINDVLSANIANQRFANQPILASVDIHETNNDKGSVIIVPKKNFRGAAEVEITLSSDSGTTTKTITVHQEKFTPDTPALEIIYGAAGAEGSQEIEIVPGGHYEFIAKVNADYDVELNASCQGGFGSFVFDIEEYSGDLDGDYKISFDVPSDFDGDDLYVVITATSTEFSNAPLALVPITLTTHYASQPTITLKQDGISISSSIDVAASGELITAIYDLGVSSTYADFEYDFSASVDAFSQANGVSVSLDADTLILTLTIDQAFSGIIELTLSALQDIYSGTSIAATEKTVYISNLSTDGEGLQFDSDEETAPPLNVLIEAGNALGVTIDAAVIFDGDYNNLIFSAESASFKVVVESVTNNNDGTVTANLLIPEGYAGLFDLNFSAIFAGEFGEDFGEEELTLMVTAPMVPDGYIEGDELPGSSIVPENRITENLEDFDNIVTAVSDGSMLLVLDRLNGLAILDNSDPANPTVIDIYDNVLLTDTSSYQMKLFTKNIDNTPRYFAMVATSAGLVSIEYNDEGNFIQGYEATGLSSSIVAYDLEIAYNKAYIAAGGGVVICSLADPTSPEYKDVVSALSPTSRTASLYGPNPKSSKLWTYYFTNVKDVELRQGRLFVAESTGGYVLNAQGNWVDHGTEGWIGIFNLADNGLSLTKAGIIRIGDPITDMLIQGSKLFFSSGTTVRAISVANAANPISRGSFETNGQIQCLSAYNNTLAVTTYNGYEFFDTTLLAKTQKTDTFEIDSDMWVRTNFLGGQTLYDHYIFSSGDYAYVSSPMPGLLTAQMNIPDMELQNRDKVKIELENSTITINFVGDGTLNVKFTNDSIESMSVTGSSEKTKITIKVNSGDSIQIGDISVDGNLHSFIAKDSIAVGDISIGGEIRKIQLGGIGDSENPAEQTVTIGGDENSKPSTLILGSIKDAQITSDGPVANFMAYNWYDDETGTADIITAPYIKKFKIKATRNIENDFEADIDASLTSVFFAGNVSESEIDSDGGIGKIVIKDNLADSTIRSGGQFTTFTVDGTISNSEITSTGDLRVVNIKEDFSDSVISTDGNIKKIEVRKMADNIKVRVSGDVNNLSFGQLKDSDIYAGFIGADIDDVTALPSAAELADGSLFDPSKTIGTINIKSIKENGTWLPGMTNSSIAAGTIKKAIVISPEFDNSDTVFGLAADELKTLIVKDKNDKNNNAKHKNLTTAADSLEPLNDDFYIRIV